MIFSHCPTCTLKTLEYDDIKRYYCPECDFTYYHNPAAAVAGIILFNNKLLLIKRAKDPGKGKLDLPGGFVDPGESAEDGLKREIHEELGIHVTSCKYFMSLPNTYDYKGIIYPTCDLIFEITIETFPGEWEKDEIEDVILVHPASAAALEFAFPSGKAAIGSFVKQRNLS
ncbi:MAG: NUDIX domain-containing protein [Spirochaetales bacterium]|nr:NUDIX domain-containing protein [Spirochaetales bacterium]